MKEKKGIEQFASVICPICGNHRRKGNHAKCSRIMQKMKAEERARK